jgi:glutamate synthase (NADPH/NADH) small chain
VTVFERADRIGGLLRYGIPEFKLEKGVLDRRLTLMEAEGIVFRPNAEVGVNVAVANLRSGFDALLLAGGSTLPRDLTVPGRDLDGIHFAMDYLPQANRRCEGDTVPAATLISAKGKKVVIIGGGDTGADCLGTAHRQGAASVTQFELLPRPPASRAADNPWPLWPNVFRVSTAHEEGGERDYCISTKQFTGTDGKVATLHGVRVEFAPGPGGRPAMRELPGTEFEMEADLVLLAMGFLGPERKTMLAQLGVAITERGTVAVDTNKMTNVPGVFAAGDTARGQSLVVWAIREGRQAAKGIDVYLMGSTDLP